MKLIFIFFSKYFRCLRKQKKEKDYDTKRL